MNYDVYRALNGLTGNPVADGLMKFVAQDLIYFVFLAFAVLCVAALRRRQMVALGQAMVTLVVAFVLGLVAARLHRESRPFTAHRDAHLLIHHAAGQSFPSDHATAAFAIAGATLFFLSRRWGVVLLVAACAIAFARVYVGVHYPGDVLAAFVLAAIGVLVARASAPWVHQVAGRLPASVTRD
jgi:undecaprenyl-diphosphatase